MARRLFAAVVVAFGTVGSIAFSDEPAKNPPAKSKEYHIELQVFQGDPLGSKAEGNLESVARPVLVVSEGQSARFASGQKLSGFDPDNPDFAGISIKLRPVEQKDGTIRMEIDFQVSELVAQNKDGHEIRIARVRQMRKVRAGDLFKIRAKGQSATDQTWVEVTVKEVEIPLYK